MGKKGKMPDMNLPIWFDGQNINEALFCEEFLRERRIIFANGAFFTPDGRVTDDLPLRGEIYDKLKFCAVNNILRMMSIFLEVLKLEAQVPDFPPEQDRIHVANGTLLQNGTFFNMNVRNEIKAQIIRAGMTMQEVVDLLSDEYGWSDSVSNLSAKLQRESIRYKEVLELADVLGYDIVWQQRREK